MKFNTLAKIFFASALLLSYESQAAKLSEMGNKIDLFKCSIIEFRTEVTLLEGYFVATSEEDAIVKASMLPVRDKASIAMKNEIEKNWFNYSAKELVNYDVTCEAFKFTNRGLSGFHSNPENNYLNVK